MAAPPDDMRAGEGREGREGSCSTTSRKAGSTTRTYAFDIHTPQRVWHFACEEEEGRKKWVEKLEKAIVWASRTKAITTSPNVAAAATAAAAKGIDDRKGGTLLVPTQNPLVVNVRGADRGGIDRADRRRGMSMKGLGLRFTRSRKNTASS